MPSSVDWAAYAREYDSMAASNPAYRAIEAAFSETIARWRLGAGETLVEVGAGTGNFTIRAARRFPEARIIHVDASSAMNEVATKKAHSLGCENLILRTSSVEQLDFDEGSLAAIVCVHALYTFPNPHEVLRRLNRWLAPGGHLFLCDLGRPLDLGDWSRYLFREIVQREGVRAALNRFWRGRVVAKANRLIRAAQRSGRYWVHSHEELVHAVSNAGFRVERSRVCYRGYSDLVSATRA